MTIDFNIIVKIKQHKGNISLALIYIYPKTQFSKLISTSIYIKAITIVLKISNPYRQVDAPVCAGAVVPCVGSEELVRAGHEGAGDGLVDGRHQLGSSAAR